MVLLHMHPCACALAQALSKISSISVDLPGVKEALTELLQVRSASLGRLLLATVPSNRHHLIPYAVRAEAGCCWCRRYVAWQRLHSQHLAVRGQLPGTVQDLTTMPSMPSLCLCSAQANPSRHCSGKAAGVGAGGCKMKPACRSIWQS